MIVSTTAFLRRNNGRAVLPETRPYTFNEVDTGAARDSGQSGAYWLGVAGAADQAVSRLEKLLDTRHPGLLDAPGAFELRSDIAYWRGESGDATGALELFEQLLADVVPALGADDFYALATRNNVAYWRGFNGDVAGALTHEGLPHLVHPASARALERGRGRSR